MVKRLLCIVSSLDTGGAETFMMKVYRGLDKNKYQIDFAVSADGFYDKEVKELGGKIHKIPLRSEHPVKVFCQLKKIVKENRYESVLKLGNSPLCVVDLIAAKMGGAKNCAMRSCNALTNLSFKQKFIDAVFRPVLNKLTTVKIAPSDLAAEYTFGKRCVQKEKVNFLHNAVDLNVVKYNEAERVNIRKELGVENNLVVGHVGRLSRQKNHMFLLDVFFEIKKKNRSAVLILVGKGELESDIRTKIDALGLVDSVIFTGVRTDIPSLMSAMDVFIMPSFFEGMPNTVIEAQATGLPCVIADTITREANITGLVEYLPLQEPENWAKKAIQAAEKHRMYTKQIFMNKQYDIESTVQNFLKLVFGE